MMTVITEEAIMLLSFRTRSLKNTWSSKHLHAASFSKISLRKHDRAERLNRQTVL
jgi:hypothetical protein